MDLSPNRLDAVLVLAPAGRIDHAHTEAFQQALAPYLNACTADGDRLVLDLAAVEYISSVGLRALMLAIRQVKSQQGRMALCRLQPLVREVFEISRFNLLFQIFDSPDEAARALA